METDNSSSDPQPHEQIGEAAKAIVKAFVASFPAIRQGINIPDSVPETGKAETEYLIGKIAEWMDEPIQSAINAATQDLTRQLAEKDARIASLEKSDRASYNHQCDVQHVINDSELNVPGSDLVESVAWLVKQAEELASAKSALAERDALQAQVVKLVTLLKKKVLPWIQERCAEIETPGMSEAAADAIAEHANLPAIMTVLAKTSADFTDKVTLSRAEANALKADKARLEWLQSLSIGAIVQGIRGAGYFRITDAAIDAAMADAGKKDNTNT